MAEVDQTVMRMVFESYGVKDYESHKALTTHMLRLMKYRVPEEEEGDQVFPPHTDKSFITVLSQNEVAGFQVKTKDGEWIRLDLSPTSFIVVAGDAFLAWSNGKIKAVEHRVMMTGNKSPRYSLGLFVFRKGIVQVPKEVISEENPRRFKPFDNLGLVTYFLTEGMKVPRVECSLEAYCGV